MLTHPASNGCVLLRGGSKHSLFANPLNRSTSAIPSHGEINDRLVRKICKDLGAPVPSEPSAVLGAEQDPASRSRG